MLELDEALKQRFEDVATAMKARLNQKPSPMILRALLKDREIGRFRQCRRLESGQLRAIAQRGSVAGVDGSTNSGGGKYPYTITVQRALAKGCDPNCPEVSVADAFSPLLIDPPVAEEDYRRQVKQNLAALEAKAALCYIREHTPSVMLIDGSLVRLKIEAQGLWEELKDLALSRETVLVGVVEGISTGVIGDALRQDLPPSLFQAADWELLTGLLNLGEVLEVRPGLFKEGFRTCFARFTPDPKPIGIDLLEEQQTKLSELQDMLYTLTPQRGRGIPLWLDIIDEKVRITDKMVEGLLKAHLGEAYYEFLLEKRHQRDW